MEIDEVCLTGYDYSPLWSLVSFGLTQMMDTMVAAWHRSCPFASGPGLISTKQRGTSDTPQLQIMPILNCTKLPISLKDLRTMMDVAGIGSKNNMGTTPVTASGQ